MSSLVPAYIKKAYSNEPLFQDSKMLYSVYNSSFHESFSESFFDKASINNMDPEDLEAFKGENGIDLLKGALSFSDALIVGSEEIDESSQKTLDTFAKPALKYHDEASYLPAYMEFYQSLLQEEELENS